MEEVQLCSPGSLEATTSQPRGRMVCSDDCSVFIDGGVVVILVQRASQFSISLVYVDFALVHEFIIITLPHAMF